jgi:type I restriction enzyme, S subunit
MSIKGWPLRPLGACAKFLSGGTPSKARADFWEGDIPWVSSREMAQMRIHDTPLRITAEGAEDGSRLVPANTVLAVVRGMSLAKEFRVAITKREVAFNQDLKAFECKPDVDSEFLFYALFARREHIRELAAEASHGTKKLETDVLAAVELPVPNLDVQRRTVAVASAYDDLLENNRRRTALLEEAARQLYREWFVHLRFPGHEHTRLLKGLPEGWERVPLGDRVTLNYGKALKADERVDGPFPVYGSSGIVGSHEKALVQGPGIILGRKGNVGSVFWSSKNFCPIDTVYFIDAETSNLYLFYALKHMHFISTDVAVPGLNRDLAYSRPLILPSKTILQQFLETVSLMHEQLDKLEEMNSKLKAARDLLLPRLMSGEITA